MLAVTIEIGTNLYGVILQVLTLIASILGGSAAFQARRRVNEVQKETRPNGGSSMRDAVNDIRSAVTSLHERATGEPPPK